MSDTMIRHMRSEDVEEVMRLAEMERWNYSPGIIRAFLEANSEGSFIAEYQGNVVGVIMGFILNESEAFKGMWIVSKEWRGQRIGARLWNRVMEHVGSRNLGIFSVEDRIEPNRRLGFKIESWKVGHISGTIDAEKLHQANDNLLSIVLSSDIQFENLLQYDTTIHTIKRERFLKLWIEKESTLTVVAKDSGNDIVGYGVIQRGSDCNIIGPLYGDSSAIRQNLLVQLIKRSSGGHIEMWIPVKNEMYQDLLKQNESTLKVLYESTRMFCKHEVSVPVQKILAIASAEISLC